MHVQTIRFAEATISLNPEEASRLAATCRLARDALTDEHDPAYTWYDAAIAAFQALAAAATAVGHIHVANLTQYHTDLDHLH